MRRENQDTKRKNKIQSGVDNKHNFSLLSGIAPEPLQWNVAYVGFTENRDRTAQRPTTGYSNKVWFSLAAHETASASLVFDFRLK